MSVPVADACCDLLELFAGVSDGRVGPGRDHPVAAVLALAAAAVVAGMRGYTAITGWVADVCQRHPNFDPEDTQRLDQGRPPPTRRVPDGQIFTSLPRSDRINAVQAPAEEGDCRQAYDGRESVVALAGSAQSPRNPASTEPCISAEPATSGSAR